MSFWVWLLLATAGTYAAARVGTGLVLDVVSRKSIVDQPTERSSHAGPTPTGGGLAITCVIAVAWLLIAALHARPPAQAWVVPLAALGLAGLSWWDDLRGLPMLGRLGAQCGQTGSTRPSGSTIHVPRRLARYICAA